jgi:predicted DNA-binding transcriptional regulator AlpA
LTDAETTSAPDVTDWNKIPVLLDVALMSIVLRGICPKSIFRLVDAGQIPKPVIRKGRIVLWEKAAVQQHLEIRKRMG